MSNTTSPISNKRTETLEQLRQVFVQHAINNRGVLTSARRAQAVSEALYDLFIHWLEAKTDAAAISHLTTQFAQQGMAITTGSALLRTLLHSHQNQHNSGLDNRLAEFQLLFLEHLSQARELVLHESQEASQHALQRSLTMQLQQQERLRLEQEHRSQTLHQLLELNSDLAQLRHETALLDASVSGLCRKLDLADVTIYQWHGTTETWELRSTTASSVSAVQPQQPEVAAALKSLYSSNSKAAMDVFQMTTLDNGLPGFRLGSLLHIGRHVMGAIVARVSHTAAHTDDIPLFLKTFAANLSTLWRNLTLFLEARERAQELEILQGRYVDSLWNVEDNVLSAESSPHGVQIERMTAPLAAADSAYPLTIGSRPFGFLKLPENTTLLPEQQEFLNALLREMSNALNNAQLIQVTQAYSTQLQVAAEVSRAATTFLQKDDLIRSVVDLIQNRFNFHYTALFLLVGDEIRLQAETGQVNSHLTFPMVVQVSQQGVAHLEQITAQVSPEQPAELFLPLQTRGRKVGVLAIQRTNTPFTNQDMAILQSLADQLATAIENATLFEQLQSSLAETNRLYEMGRRLTEAIDGQMVMQTLVDFSAQSGLLDMCHTLAEDSTNRDQITVHAFWRHDGGPFRGMPNSVQRNQYALLEWVRQNELFVITDGQTDERLSPDIQALFRVNGMRAAAFIPIQRNNQWYGTLILDRIEARPFTRDELQPFIALCDQAATTLANQHLLRETGALYRVSRILNQTVSQEDALSLTVTEIAQNIGVPQCRVVLVEKKSGRGRVVAEYVPTTLSGQDLFPADDWRLQYLRQHRQPLLVQKGNRQFTSQQIQTHLKQFQAKHSLLIPLISQIETIGWITLDAISGIDAFTPANLNFVQTLADQLTTTIESIKLYDEAVQRNRELITLNRIGATISGILDLTQLGPIVYNQVDQLIDNTAFILAMYDPSSHQFTPLSTFYNGTAVNIPGHKIKPTDELHHFLHTGLPFTANSHCPLLRETGLSQFVPTEPNVQSTIWMPLLQEKRPMGLIGLGSHWAHAYSDNEIQLLRSIATQTGLTIANSRLFQEIENANEKLRQLDRMKTQFLANMSHELRTPLNSIIGFSRIMLKGIDGPITPSQHEDLSSINSSGQHLLNLINDILDQAKIEAGKMELHFQPVDLYEIAEMVLSATRSLIKNNQIELRSKLEPDLPLIEGDQVRLRQILMNFLSNAAKFTESGHITLAIRRYQETQVLISVTDTGMGIAEKDFDKIFQAFEQVDSTSTRSAGGTGLGLPITRWLTKEHGGEIWFESRLNGGTTFYISLPIQQKQNKAQE